MNSAATARVHPGACIRSNGASAPAREWIQRFSQCCEEISGAFPRNSGEQLIADVETGGARYLLIRICLEAVSAQPQLSPREMEIARMVAKGYPNKTIAGVLEISSWTVCTHLRRIFAKLGVTSRAAMVAKLGEERVLHAPVYAE